MAGFFYAQALDNLGNLSDTVCMKTTEQLREMALNTPGAFGEIYKIAWDRFGLRASQTAVSDYLTTGTTRKSKKQDQNNAAIESALRHYFEA